jgi:hypothetical protein
MSQQGSEGSGTVAGTGFAGVAGRSRREAAPADAGAASDRARPALWRRAVAWIGVAAVGAILLIAAAIKALHPAGFAEQIALDVPFLAPWAVFLSVAGIAFEAVLGVAYILGLRQRWLVGAGIGLVLLFIATTVPKIGDPEAAACGCFGNFVVRTPGQVIMEDLLMLVGLIAGLLGGRGGRWTGWRVGILAVVLAGSIAFPLAAPSLPLDDFATRLAPGASLKDIQMLEAIPELGSGRHVVTLVDSGALGSCEDVPDSLHDYAAARPEVSIWIVRQTKEMSEQAQAWLCLPGASTMEVPAAILRPMYRTLPRSFEAVDGQVTATWQGLPGDGHPSIPAR